MLHTIKMTEANDCIYSIAEVNFMLALRLDLIILKIFVTQSQNKSGAQTSIKAQCSYRIDH
jgi:hypothetical protein